MQFPDATYIDLLDTSLKSRFRRTYTGIEVDAVLGDGRVAIEIKSVEEVLPRHLKGLKTFADEHPQSRRIIVSLDVINRVTDGIECLHVTDFFRQLWEKGL